MKRKLTALFLSLALATTNIGIVPIADAAQNDPVSPSDVQRTTAPEKDLQINFWLEEGVP